MTKRLAKNVITEWEESDNCSLCVAMLTQAHATVEGENTENLPSEEKRGIELTLKLITLNLLIMMGNCCSLEVL